MLHIHTKYDVTWVSSKLLGATGSLGEKALELKNWLLRFRWHKEELRVEVAGLEDWMEKFPPFAHHTET